MAAEIKRTIQVSLEDENGDLDLNFGNELVDVYLGLPGEKTQVTFHREDFLQFLEQALFELKKA